LPICERLELVSGALGSQDSPRAASRDLRILLTYMFAPIMIIIPFS